MQVTSGGNLNSNLRQAAEYSLYLEEAWLLVNVLGFHDLQLV